MHTWKTSLIGLYLHPQSYTFCSSGNRLLILTTVLLSNLLLSCLMIPILMEIRIILFYDPWTIFPKFIIPIQDSVQVLFLPTKPFFLAIPPPKYIWPFSPLPHLSKCRPCSYSCSDQKFWVILTPLGSSSTTSNQPTILLSLLSKYIPNTVTPHNLQSFHPGLRHSMLSDGLFILIAS